MVVNQAVEDLDQLLRLAEREAELAGPLSGDADLRAPRTLWSISAPASAT